MEDVYIEVDTAQVCVEGSEGTHAVLSSPGTSVLFPRAYLPLPTRELVLVGGASPRAPTGV